VSVPPREYELAARLLVQAVESDSSDASWGALFDAAQQFGAELGRRSRASCARGGTRQDIGSVLRAHGFEPWQDEDGIVRLGNCPFHRLAADHPRLVCGMNLALIEGRSPVSAPAGCTPRSIPGRDAAVSLSAPARQQAKLEGPKTFSGVAHVGYLPGERILGLSKLARLVEHFAARPQTQERLTKQVADRLGACLRPRGAGVVLEAGHSRMTLRGVRALGATTITSALLGTLRADAHSRAEFFALAGVPG